MNKKVKVSFENFGVDKKKIENETDDKLTVKADNKLFFYKRDVHFCKIVFRGQAENSGGYLTVNGFAISVNSTVIMPICPPVAFELGLIISPYSSIVFEELTFEELGEKEYLDETCEEKDVLIITPDYPSYINLYLCAFVHSRNMEYKRHGLEFQVVTISPNNWFESLTDFQGISVLCGNAGLLKRILRKRRHKCIIVHFVDNTIFRILDEYTDDVDQMIFICHGPETLYRYLVNVTRPYFTEPIDNVETEEFSLSDRYIKEYSQRENVEWVFVSEWLLNFSRKLQQVEFKKSRVISNVINEKLFPYREKGAEDRKKILVIRKFDNISFHSLDQVVLAILELSKREFFNDLVFDIYGDGNYYEELIEPIKMFENVHLHRKFIPNDKISDIHRNSGILLCPSRYDTQGVTLGEAASSGLVVIGSKVTCLPYFMQEDKFHTLAEPENYVQLADIVERFYGNPEEFLRVSKGMSDFIHRVLGIKNTVEKEIQLIQEKLDTIKCREERKGKMDIRKPILSILIPVYNTEKYIRRCMDSLLVPEVNDDIEVLVVSDGSKDDSVHIVKEYVERYPDTVVLVDKENGGHGSTINVGIEKARGKYFRVLDSDDWFNTTEFVKFVTRLKDEDADLVVCDYRKEHTYNSRSEYFEYKNLEDMKQYDLDQIDVGILAGEYFVMATSTYKTDVLRSSGLKLLEKTFYVDMQYNVVPITKVKTFTYYHLDIYRYFIGRKEQSMNMDNFVRNQEHHKKMIKWLIEYYTGISDQLSKNKREYIEIILTYTLNTHYSIYCEYDNDHARAYREIKDFDKYLMETNKKLYGRLNCMAYVRYNRKTKFKFVRINGKKWNTAMQMARRLKGR